MSTNEIIDESNYSMITSYRRYRDSRKNSLEFVHFDCEYECNNFIKSLGRENEKKVKSRCCSNKGFGYYPNEYDNDFQQIINNYKKYETKKYETKKVIVKNCSDTDCCVCLLKNERFTKCGHNFCITCENSWKKTCPMCREPIK
uniref:RING-type domain-containing protein n=1 Tax=viral metagenome TaxID=1070528 RepID=A0A6C0KXB0_9ZZZZ